MYFHHQQVHAYQGIAINEHISTLGTCCLQLDNCTRLMLTTFTSASQQLLYVIIIIWRDNELCRSLPMVDTAQSVQCPLFLQTYTSLGVGTTQSPASFNLPLLIITITGPKIHTHSHARAQMDCFRTSKGQNHRSTPPSNDMRLVGSLLV